MARNRTDSGLDGDGQGGAGRRNVPIPERTTDSVVRSGGDVGVKNFSEKICTFSENSGTLAKKRLRSRQFSENSCKKIELAKIPAKLARKSVISGKKKNTSLYITLYEFFV